ncbi:hypothetical protein LSCM1_05788 [Leishmania martiniquensis]|uniref:Uncharacterized protein n=1 Tax=Leishmania martiniquensis TaxID=1580590 RepID=A0A836GVH0_9TRYP|nr:hypothetical protein LSCM1_05788 [Leishmania martiniquensis]
MRWRRVVFGGLSGRQAASAALVLATRHSRPPCPPAWASTSLRRGSMTASLEGRQEAVLSPVVAASAQPFAGLQREEGSLNLRPAAQPTAAAQMSPYSVSSGSPAAATTPPPLLFASGALHRAVGAEALAALPKSYAYVNSVAGTNAPVAQPSASRASSSALPGYTAAATAAPAGPRVKVAVDGEKELVAAAPGAVRRALGQHASSADGDMGGSDTTLALLRTVAPPLVTASRDSSSEGSHVPGSTASSTPAERHKHRERQRQIREARERRRQERAQQQSGADVHPCRVQGGCRHQISGSSTHSPAGDGRVIGAVTHASVCPYRHYPSHYCVRQLRNGHCFLHDVGCCPWTHSDLGEGAARASSRSLPSDPDAHFDVGLHGCSPLLPLETTLSHTPLQRSAEKVGELLLLFLDAVSVMMEEALGEQQIHSARGDVSDIGGCAGEGVSRLLSSWGLLEEVVRRSSMATVFHEAPTSAAPAGVKGGGVGLRLEVLPNGDSTDDTRAWRMLSVPAEVAWCALTSHRKEEAPSFHSGVETNAADSSPFTAEELEYWSSYFLLTAPPHAAAEGPAAVGVSRDGCGALQGSEPDLPRVRLTPCATAWVLKAAATLMHVKSNQRTVTGGLDDGTAFSAPPATTASACFEQATLYLLGWRRAQLQRYLIGEVYEATSPSGVKRLAVDQSSTVMPKEAEAAAAARQHGQRRAPESSLRWSPVSFLKDALLCTYLHTAQRAHVAFEQEIMGDEGESGANAKESHGINTNGCTTLLDLFLTAVCTGGATASLNSAGPAASVRDGALFSTDGSRPPAPPSSSAAAQSASMSPKSSAAASTERFRKAWDEAHAVIVQLHKGLLQCLGGQATMALAVAAPLCLYTQPAMLHVASSLSAGFARCYEADLRSTAGWQPWTDVQMFHKGHAAVYNADTYSRHHMPAARLGLLNSLLNALLVLTTHYVDTVFQLQEPSDVRRVLLSSPARDLAAAKCEPVATFAAAQRQAVSWWSAVQQEAPAHRQQHLQASIAISMGLLTALQEHSREQLEIRDTLMREYEQRRTANERNHEERQDGLFRCLSNRGASRNSKYHGYSAQSTDLGLAEQRERLEELRGVSLLDRLLPFGSVTVSPNATASLLRQLLEGGHPYKALKLAASIVHASRMLRHADKQPRPSLQPGLRRVHTRVWSRRLQRHVLVKKHVPVLRLVGGLSSDGLGDGNARPGAQARRSVRPVGLTFVISDRVVIEMARVGLRMGAAGAALVSGVMQDCQRGALLDFTHQRGLPAPTLQDITEMVSKEQLAQSLSSMVMPASTPIAPAASSLQLHERSSHGGRRRGAQGSGAALLVIMGLGAGEARFGGRGSEGWGAAHQRIAPTAGLLEVLETHTPPSSTAEHTAYLKLLLEDAARFSTMPVLLALQYQACFDRSRYATSRADGLSGAAAAMQTAYVMTVSATRKVPSLPESTRAPSSPTTSAAANGDDASRTCPIPGESSRLLQALREEAEAQRPAVQEAILSDASSLHRHRRVEEDVYSSSSLAASQSNLCMDDVRALLLGTFPSGGALQARAGERRDGEEGSAAAPAVRRRPRLSLAVLLHHLWSSSMLARSSAQQITSLWAVCAGTLLGLSETALSRSRASGDTERGRLEADGAHASLALRHAYVAAGPLLRQEASRCSPLYVDATVKALLLCRPLASAEESGKEKCSVAYEGRSRSSSATTASRATRTFDHCASTHRSEHPKDAWPMLFSSANATQVRSLPTFLALQCALCAAAYSVEEDALAAEAPLLPLIPASLASIMEGLSAVRAVPPDRVREWPAWKLFEPLMQHPVLAQMWLHDTFLYPSSNLLMWLVGALSQDDVEGYAVLRAWLRHIQAGPHLPLAMLQALLAETERRYRSAVTRRMKRQRR